MRFLSHLAGYIRGLRVTAWVYNLTKYRKLKPNASRYQQLGIKKKVWQGLSHTDIKKPAAERPWMDVPPTATEIKAAEGFLHFSPAIQQKILEWPEKGYIILENFFTPDEANAVNTEIQHLLDTKKIDYNGHFSGYKLMDTWKQSNAVNHLFRHQELLRILSFLLGKEVVPFQTINFQKGSQQRTHSDSIHMTTEPLGYLIATWTALEDVTDGSGQLMYYPGSHKLKYVLSEDFDTGNSLWQLGADHYKHYEDKIAGVVAAHKLQPQFLMAKKGDVLIWHANLLHGGSPIKDVNATRKSQVAHYFGKDVLCYHEINQRPAIINA